jgi:hypothetical protein
VHKWTEERWYGVLLVATSIAGVLILAHHPTGGGMLHAGDPARAARLNRLIHAIAIGVMPIQLLGFVGLSRRLGLSLFSQAALVAELFGLFAGMSAAVASGFVATQVILGQVEAGPSAPINPLLGYTGWWNQGLAAVYVVGTAAAIVLFSIAILQTGRLSRIGGWLGMVIGTAMVLWQVVGHVRLDVRHFGMIVFAEAVWGIWAGAEMFIRGRSGTA